MAKPKTPGDVVRAYREVFCLPNGGQSQAQRIVLGDLLKQTGAMQDIVQYDPAGRVDEHATLVAVGRQYVGTYILNKLNLPDRHLAVVADDAIRVEVQRNDR